MTISTLLKVNNPSSGSTISELEVDDLDSAIKKIERAQQLFENTSQQLSLPERIAMMKNVAHAIGDHHEEFAMTIAEEGGKPLIDARVEVTRAIAGIHTAIETMSAHRGNVIPLGYQSSSVGRMGFTQVFPRGVVLAFSAFNHPLNLIIHQIIPAFATGCPCVVKPAPNTPLSCIKLVELMYEIGIPKDYIRYVITEDHEIADAMVRSDNIAFFSFIGSAKVGWMLRSRLQPGVRCALEHGGVAPCIVTASADLNKAIPAITKGGFYHAGQVCVSTQRIYVDQAISDEFTEKLAAAVSQLTVGPATQDNTDVGPLIRPQEALRVHAWIKEARELGAKIITGGEAPHNNFLQPTVILSPPSTAKVSTQEIFGPVVCIYPVENIEQAMQLVNIKPFAFQACIFTEQLEEVYQAYEGLAASAVMVNDHTAFRDDAMPFAGLDASGLGVGGIPYTIKEMQFEKMLVLNHK